MILAYFGLFTGVFITWVWLTAGSPYARNHKDEPGMVNVRCNYCGRMNWMHYSDIRVDTKCVRCR